MSHSLVDIVFIPSSSTRQFNIGVKMFIALLACFFFGATVCVGVSDETPDATPVQQELFKELGKVIMQTLGVKNPPMMSKQERRKHLPKSLVDLYNKEDNGSESKPEERSNTTFQDFENEGL